MNESDTPVVMMMTDMRVNCIYSCRARALCDMTEAIITTMIKLPSNWDIKGLTRHDCGYMLSEQVFCVQSGCCSHKYIENTARLITTCFMIRGEDEKQIGMIETGGLTWDFMISVHRGSNVEDVVAVCMMVHGRCDPDDGRQLMYIFDVCTDPHMARRGIGKVLMDSVYRLCEAMIADGQFTRDRLWLVLDVDLKSTVVVPPVKLISFYKKCGFSELSSSAAGGGGVTGIKPAEVLHPRWSWCITCDPTTRCQLWREVVVVVVAPEKKAEKSGCLLLFSSLPEEVISELKARSSQTRVVIDRIERLLDFHLSCTMEAPQLLLCSNNYNYNNKNDYHSSSSSFCAVLPTHLKSSRV
jgi:GNAT superfamily N-acetyltransferase